MCQACLRGPSQGHQDGLLQTTFCRLDHTLKYAPPPPPPPPPGGLLQIECPLYTKFSELSLHIGVIKHTLEVAFNVLPNHFGWIPHLTVKCLKLLIKVTAFKSGTKSRCTALVTQQVYRHSHTFGFSVAKDGLTYSGPAKSTPV